MKKLITVGIFIALILSFCGCDDSKNSSADSTEVTTTTTQMTTTTPELTTMPPITTTAPVTTSELFLTNKNSVKYYSQDKFFSVTYTFSTATPKANVPFTVKTVFKNETKNTFLAGTENSANPVVIWFDKKDNQFNYQSNNVILNWSIQPDMVVESTQTITLGEKGEYTCNFHCFLIREFILGERYPNGKIPSKGEFTNTEIKIPPVTVNVT